MSYLGTSLSSVTGESGRVLHAVAERMMSAPKVRKLISRKLSILQHGVIHRVGTSLVRPLFTEPALPLCPSRSHKRVTIYMFAMEMGAPCIHSCPRSVGSCIVVKNIRILYPWLHNTAILEGLLVQRAFSKQCEGGCVVQC